MTNLTIFATILLLAGCIEGVSSHPGDIGSGPDATLPEIVHVTGPKQVFVTSVTYQGGLLGGLSGADQKCNTLAAAAVPALTGEYKAWLSTIAAPASTRLTQSSGPYSLVDGTAVATSWDELVQGTLMHAINLDESGHPSTAPTNCMGKVGAWTGTEYDGTAYPKATDCHDWTALQVDGFFINGVAGDISKTDSHWSDMLCAPSCTSQASLYCIEQ